MGEEVRNVVFGTCVLRKTEKKTHIDEAVELAAPGLGYSLNQLGAAVGLGHVGYDAADIPPLGGAGVQQVLQVVGRAGTCVDVGAQGGHLLHRGTADAFGPAGDEDSLAVRRVEQRPVQQRGCTGFRH